LFLLLGAERTDEILNFSSELAKNTATIPSTLFLAALVFTSYWLMKKFESRKASHATTQQKNSR